jgi:hypothetical protein
MSVAGGPVGSGEETLHVVEAADSNDRPIGVVARDMMTFLGWL